MQNNLQPLKSEIPVINISPVFKAAVILGLISSTLAIGAWGLVGYVTWHFISKIW